MEAKRLQRGFRRLGIVLAVPCFSLSAAVGAYSAYQFANLPKDEIVADVLRGKNYYFPKGTEKPVILTAPSKELGRPVTD